MQTLRRAHLITRFVLVWFALSLGVAVASTVVQPKGLDVVCTSAGSLKLVSQEGGANGQQTLKHALDCPLCCTTGAPPPVVFNDVDNHIALAHALLPLSLAHIASLTAPPLPSRGPPVFLL